MKAIKKYILLLAAGCAFAASAQEAPRTAYFMDGYTFRHELNPAFHGERGYFSMPVLANIDVALFSNVGVNTFLYKTQPGSKYGLETFMSPNVSAETFLSKLQKNNHINGALDLTILSAGFKAFHGFNTITIGVHGEAGFNLPKDLFTFMKMGQTGPDTKYSFGDVQANGNVFAEVALGHSHRINNKLDIGAKVKVLVGLANVTARIDKMDVALSSEKWMVDAKGSIEISGGTGLSVPTKGENDPSCPAEERDLIEWDDIDMDGYSPSGFGIGFDLGATYKLIPGLTLSAAVTDLGFIHWKNAIKGFTGMKPWTFDGFHNVYIGDSEENTSGNKDLNDQLDDLTDDLDELMNFHRAPGAASYTKALHATLRVGAEYEMPFYNKLTAGFLFSSYFGGCMSWQEGRFYANVKPVKWFDCTVNYGASTYGSSLGWMLNFHPKGFNFFIGSDHMFTKLTPQFVPVGNACINVNLGINFTFGS